MALYIIDGDNAPGTRTKGLHYLSAEDTVCICYANTNKYYQNQTVVKQLRDTTEATIHFYFTETTKQAVDFYIAIKAEAYIQQGAKEVYLISGDNHMATIATILQKLHTNTKVGRVTNIYEGYISDLSRVSNLTMAKNILCDLFDEEKGQQFYTQLENLFAAELTPPKEKHFLQKIFERFTA